jgi:phosphohistidine phosphatase
MRLFFIRHAEALGANFPGGDAERPLSPRGQEQAARLARFLARAGVQLSQLFASPLVRAQQTAQALVEAGVAGTVSVCQELLPEKGLAPLLAFLETRGEGDVGLVGHQPQLSEALEALATGTVRGFVALPKGSVAALAREEGHWELMLLIHPSWLPPEP